MFFSSEINNLPSSSVPTDGDVSGGVAIGNLSEHQRRHVTPLCEGDADGLPGVFNVQSVWKLCDPATDSQTGC